MKADAGKLAAKALETEDELSLVENHLIPALDKVGEDYDKGTAFLPQLLSAAQAAQAVFEVIRSSIAAKGGVPVKKGKLIVATVQGDIHDIGKNIVKTVLGNYGYEVLDLGRDVPPETILRTVQEQGVRLVGLSALMTTTLPAMEKTIRLLHTMEEPPVIFVGGAVVQWLRDELHLITEASDTEYFAKKVPDSAGVYLVPAFTGLGAPYWDMYARGTIVGLTRGTTKAHIARAVLEYCADRKRLGAKTLFATHYHELTALEGRSPG